MSFRILPLILLTLSPLSYAEPIQGIPPVTAPFKKGEDSLCVNDWWNRPTPTAVSYTHLTLPTIYSV